MHIAVHEGLRHITLTEEDFMILSTGFDALKKHCRYDELNLWMEPVTDAEDILIDGISSLCESLARDAV